MHKTPDVLVAEMDDIIRGIWTHLEDPQSLSNDILRLSVLNVGIGNALVEAQDLLNTADTERKYALQTIKLAKVKETDPDTGKKIPMGVAEAMAEIETKKLADHMNVLSKAVMLLKIKRNDTDSVIDAARSRLSLIKKDIQNA